MIDTSLIKDVTIYAIFQENPYYITFDPDNGEATQTIMLRGAEKVGDHLPADPKKDGYSFLGWYVGNTKVDSDYSSRDSVTAVAKWELIPVEPEAPKTFDGLENYVMTFAVCLLGLMLASKLRPAAIRDGK